MSEKAVKERPQTLAEKLMAKAEQLKQAKLEEIAIILVDCSGSMADHCKDGNSKLGAVKKSIPYLQAVGSYVEYGMVGFSGHATPIQNPTTSFSAILIQLDILEPQDSTNIPDALRVGLGMFIERSVDKKRMILLTDGRNNCEGAASLDTQVQHCIDQGVIVDTIAFGDDADVNLLQSIAKRTGGVFQKVDSPLQLEAAYKKLNFQVRYLSYVKEVI